MDSFYVFLVLVFTASFQLAASDSTAANSTAANFTASFQLAANANSTAANSTAANFTASFQLAANANSTDDKLKDLEQRIKKLELLESRVKALEAEDKKLRDYIDCKVNITYTYKVSKEAMNWTDAREFCVDLGGDLAMVGVKKWNIRQEIANRYLNSTKERFWIGAKKEGTGWHRSSFKWNNGKKVLRKAIHWGTFQPDNYLDSEECVEILYNADELKQWNWHANDHDCESTDARALCEIPDC